MKLRAYLDKYNITIRDFAESMGGPTFQAISRYCSGQDSPSLEAALLICRETNGQVMPHELLSDLKRKYTEDGDDICVLTMADEQPEQEEIELF